MHSRALHIVVYKCSGESAPRVVEVGRWGGHSNQTNLPPQSLMHIMMRMRRMKIDILRMLLDSVSKDQKHAVVVLVENG